LNIYANYVISSKLELTQELIAFYKMSSLHAIPVAEEKIYLLSVSQSRQMYELHLAYLMDNIQTF